MKNALIVSTTSGFLPQFELNNARLLRQRGYRIFYAANFDVPVYSERTELLDELEIIRYPIPIRKSPYHRDNLRAYQMLRELIDQRKIDLVHCHNPVGGVIGRMAAEMSRRKPYVIYTAHGFHFFRGAAWRNWLLYYPVERFLARYTDILITINREDELRAEGFRMKRGGRVERIPGVGVDTGVFYPDASFRGTERKLLGIPEQAFHIVSAGELNRNKNHSTVIEAIALLKQENIYYSICGDGPLRDELGRLIRKKGLQNRVFLRGYRTDMPQLLNSADLAIFPSFREGLGMAALEAMAVGVPLITADNRGTREFMRDGWNGLVCDPASPEQFARAIRKLYGEPGLRAVCAERAGKTVGRYTLKRSSDKMAQIYDSVPDRHGGKRRGIEGKNPAISVIMGVYNPDLPMLERAVRSVLKQSFCDFELIICDDGSDRQIRTFLRGLAAEDRRIRLIADRQNHGLGHALNRCIAAANGKYLARMDADDIAEPERFAVQKGFLEQHPEYMWCGANCVLYDSEGVWGEGRRSEKPGEKDYLKYSPFIHPTVMFRAELFHETLAYSEDRKTRRCEDYELFMRLAAHGYRGYNIQQPLLRYFVDRHQYHKRPFRYSIYEGIVRLQGYHRMGLLRRGGMWYVFRPIIGGLLPAGVIVRVKERTAEL